MLGATEEDPTDAGSPSSHPPLIRMVTAKTLTDQMQGGDDGSEYEGQESASVNSKPSEDINEGFEGQVEDIEYN